MPSIPSQIKAIIPKLRSYFQAKPEVLTVYLFGSGAKKEEGRIGDLDIGILLKTPPPEDKVIKMQSEIEGELTSILKGLRPDVVILNGAPFFLRHEVMRSNKILFERDITRRCEFEVQSELAYYDFEPMRHFFTQCMKERIREGKFGECSHRRITKDDRSA